MVLTQKNYNAWLLKCNPSSKQHLPNPNSKQSLHNFYYLFSVSEINYQIQLLVKSTTYHMEN